MSISPNRNKTFYFHFPVLFGWGRSKQGWSMEVWLGIGSIGFQKNYPLFYQRALVTELRLGFLPLPSADGATGFKWNWTKTYSKTTMRDEVIK